MVSFCIQLWHETEPFGLHLQLAPEATCIPTLIASNDIALMDLAVQQYNTKGSYMINRCRIYLRVFSIYELALAHDLTIHPSYLDGTPPPTRSSHIIWPNYLHLPTKYWSLWGHFLYKHIQPLMAHMKNFRDADTQLHFTLPFFRHKSSTHLYHYYGETITKYPHITRRHVHPRVL